MVCSAGVCEDVVWFGVYGAYGVTYGVRWVVLNVMYSCEVWVLWWGKVGHRVMLRLFQQLTFESYIKQM